MKLLLVELPPARIDRWTWRIRGRWSSRKKSAQERRSRLPIVAVLVAAVRTTEVSNTRRDLRHLTIINHFLEREAESGHRSLIRIFLCSSLSQRVDFIGTSLTFGYSSTCSTLLVFIHSVNAVVLQALRAEQRCRFWSSEVTRITHAEWPTGVIAVTSIRRSSHMRSG